MSGNADSVLSGDPSYWEWWPMFSGENDSFNMARCPQCGAAVLNVYQHKAWHLQNDGDATELLSALKNLVHKNTAAAMLDAQAAIAKAEGK